MQQFLFSAKTIKKAKSYGMKATEYLIYADLRAAGWDVKDAWAIAFQGTGLNWTKAELEKEMNKLEALASVQRRIAELKGKATAGADNTLTPEELARETSKEKILTDLVIAKRKMQYGSKEWTEQNKLIAEYARIKTDDLQTEDSTIHFFLPARYPRKCIECEHFLNERDFVLKFMKKQLETYKTTR